MEKIKIVALVGMSGSGKTHASQVMGVHEGFNTIVSYTTRPMRAGETDGVDHLFVGPEDKPKESEIVAYTVYGGYEYWTSWKQFKKDVFNVYVIDEKGLADLLSKKHMKDRIYLTTVHIIREDRNEISEERKVRDLDRLVLDELKYDYTVDNIGSLSLFNFNINQLCEIIQEER